jgi:hypothetical protein
VTLRPQVALGLLFSEKSLIYIFSILVILNKESEIARFLMSKKSLSMTLLPAAGAPWPGYLGNRQTEPIQLCNNQDRLPYFVKSPLYQYFNSYFVTFMWPSGLC